MLAELVAGGVDVSVALRVGCSVVVLALGAAGAGAGAEATGAGAEGSLLTLGVAGAALMEGAGAGTLAVTEAWVSVVTLAAAGAELADDRAGAFVAAFGAGADETFSTLAIFTDDFSGAGLASATGAALGAGAGVGVASDAGCVVVDGAACATAAGFAAAAGWVPSFFRVWSSTRAPPITVAVIAPSAIPKWFTGSSLRGQFACQGSDMRAGARLRDERGNRPRPTLAGKAGRQGRRSHAAKGAPRRHHAQPIGMRRSDLPHVAIASWATARFAPVAKNKGAELVVKNERGRVDAKDSHGRDPRRIRG